MRVGIPYKVVGGTRFYDRREIKDALAYLKAVVNPADEVSVKRVLNVPKRGIGDTTVGRLDAWANAPRHRLRRGAAPAPTTPGVTGRARQGHRRRSSTLLDDLGRAGRRRARPRCSRRRCDAVGLPRRARGRALRRGRGPHREPGRAASASARDFEPVDAFLEQVSLVADTDELDDDDSSVVLMTLHSAKGLEFPVVFLIGLEDGVFPHLRSIGEPDELEEERRLAYVGITRARERLYLTHAWCRTLYGVHPVQPAEPLPRRDPRRTWCTRSRATAAASRRRRRVGLGSGAARRLGSYGGAGRHGPRALRRRRRLGHRRGRRSFDDDRTRRGRSAGPGRATATGWSRRPCDPTRPSPSGADQLGLKVGRRRAPRHLRRRRHPRHRGRGRQGRGRRALRRRRREDAAAVLGAAREALIDSAEPFAGRWCRSPRSSWSSWARCLGGGRSTGRR